MSKFLDQYVRTKNGAGPGVRPPGDSDPAHDPPEVRAAVAAQAKLYAPGDAAGPADGPAPAPRAPRFKFITSADLAAGDYRPEWFIERVLVRKQPAVIAGPSKALKTNLSIDLAVSLAAGHPFLGRFAVPKAARVAVVSGESGAATLQETATRVCRAKGLDFSDLGDRLNWCFDLPTFSDLGSMAEFADGLAALDAEVVVLDPLYLMLGNADAKNLFEMGAALRVVSEILLKAGCTPVLLHHANRQLQVGEPMELSHLAYSGLEQLARQFILLNRRERYAGDGTHDLWATVGGSAGHGGIWALHVEEGVTDEHFAGRRWDVTVQTRDEVKADATDRRAEQKRELALRKLVEDEAAVLNVIDATPGPAATKNFIRDHTRMNSARLTLVLNGLEESGRVVRVVAKKPGGNGASQAVTSYQRPTSHERPERSER